MKTQRNCSTTLPTEFPIPARSGTQALHSGKFLEMDIKGHPNDVNQIHIRAPDPDHDIYFASLITLIR